MHKLTQTPHDPANNVVGNCFETALAGLLHIPISEVPVFPETQTWKQQVNEFLRPFNLAYIPISVDSGIAEWFRDIGVVGLHHVLAGTTERSGDVTHACIGADDEVAWDPHPSRAGLTSGQTAGILVALRPWEMPPLHNIQVQNTSSQRQEHTKPKLYNDKFTALIKQWTDNTIVTGYEHHTEDLGMDSLDEIEFIMSVEDAYGIDIPSDDLGSVTTLNRFADYLLAKHNINVRATDTEENT